MKKSTERPFSSGRHETGDSSLCFRLVLLLQSSYYYKCVFFKHASNLNAQRKCIFAGVTILHKTNMVYIYQNGFRHEGTSFVASVWCNRSLARVKVMDMIISLIKIFNLTSGYFLESIWIGAVSVFAIELIWVKQLFLLNADGLQHGIQPWQRLLQLCKRR